MEKMDYSKEDYYTGLNGIYFNRILDKVIEYGNLKQEEGIVLDFGCGLGKLKQKLKKYGIKVVGYDKLSDISDIKDYSTVKPSKIVCNQVLEHLTREEIEETIKSFIKTKADLIVSLPTENVVSKIVMLFTGNFNYHEDHKTKYRDVIKIVERYYKIVKRCYIFTMTQVTYYKPKITI